MRECQYYGRIGRKYECLGNRIGQAGSACKRIERRKSLSLFSASGKNAQEEEAFVEIKNAEQRVVQVVSSREEFRMKEIPQKENLPGAHMIWERKKVHLL